MNKKSYKEAILDTKNCGSPSEHEAGKFAFEIAKANRDFEISHFWIRASYFSVLIGAVFVGFYEGSHFKTPLAFLGLFLSVCWYCANRGSKFWQEHWEAQVDMMGSQLVGKEFFQVKIIQGKPSSCRIVSPLKSYPFSVSKLAIMVSLVISALWLCIVLNQFHAIQDIISQVVFISMIILTISAPLLASHSGFAKGVLKQRKPFDDTHDYFYYLKNEDKKRGKK